MHVVFILNIVAVLLAKKPKTNYFICCTLGGYSPEITTPTQTRATEFHPPLSAQPLFCLTNVNKFLSQRPRLSFNWSVSLSQSAPVRCLSRESLFEFSPTRPFNFG